MAAFVTAYLLAAAGVAGYLLWLAANQRRLRRHGDVLGQRATGAAPLASTYPAGNE